jgi:hypothetical protein
VGVLAENSANGEQSVRQLHAKLSEDIARLDHLILRTTFIHLVFDHAEHRQRILLAKVKNVVVEEIKIQVYLIERSNPWH